MEYWNKYKYTVINSHRKTAENDFNHIGGFLLFFLVYVILEAFAGLKAGELHAAILIFSPVCGFCLLLLLFYEIQKFRSRQAEPCRSSLRHPLQRQQMRSMRPRRPFLKGSAFSAIIATNSDLFIVTPPRSYMVILYTITDFIFWQYILMIFVVLKEK